MLRCGEDVCRLARFDDAAAEHHRYLVCQAADDGEIVRDQQDAHPAGVLELAQQIHDLLLYRRVQGGGRLIGDQQFRPAGQRHGDADALGHAAAEFMRISVEPLLRPGDPHLSERPDDFRVAGAPVVRHVGPMQRQHFGHLLADGKDGVQGRRRILENVGDLAAAHPAQLALGQAEQIAAVQQHLARFVAGGRLGQQPGQSQRGNAFPRCHSLRLTAKVAPSARRKLTSSTANLPAAGAPEPAFGFLKANSEMAYIKHCRPA